jgi:hypothetical protein
MKVQLFHAPYVDADGSERRRLCAAITGCSSSGDGDRLRRISEAIEGLGDSLHVTAFEDPDVVVEWL